MYPRSRPHDLRASDADRELVINMLGEAAADGRLSLPEHAERCEQALAARTLGELTSLTSDLALPSGQPIRLYPRRTVTAMFARERRDGRWVVPAEFPVTAFFGTVVLDLRDAVLQSQRTTIYVTAVAGQVRLIVPEGVTVEMAGGSFFGVRTVRGGARPAVQSRQGQARQAQSRQAQNRQAQAGPAGQGAVIEVRTLALGGAVKAVSVRRSRWRPALRKQ